MKLIEAPTLSRADRLRRFARTCAQALAAAAFLLGCSQVAQAAENTGISPCSMAPLLESYAEAGFLHWGEDSVELKLTADLHSADCGAPDGYGTEISVMFELKEDGSSCHVMRATVTTKDFMPPDYGAIDAREYEAAEFAFEPSTTDLLDAELSRLTLRNHDQRRAIVLLPGDFFYFEDVTEDGELRTTLDPGDSENTGCCWGAASAAFRHRSW